MDAVAIQRIIEKCIEDAYRARDAQSHRANRDYFNGLIQAYQNVLEMMKGENS